MQEKPWNGHLLGLDVDETIAWGGITQSQIDKVVIAQHAIETVANFLKQGGKVFFATHAVTDGTFDIKNAGNNPSLARFTHAQAGKEGLMGMPIPNAQGKPITVPVVRYNAFMAKLTEAHPYLKVSTNNVVLVSRNDLLHFDFRLQNGKIVEEPGRDDKDAGKKYPDYFKGAKHGHTLGELALTRLGVKPEEIKTLTMVGDQLSDLIFAYQVAEKFGIPPKKVQAISVDFDLRKDQENKTDLKWQERINNRNGLLQVLLQGRISSIVEGAAQKYPTAADDWTNPVTKSFKEVEERIQYLMEKGERQPYPTLMTEKIQTETSETRGKFKVTTRTSYASAEAPGSQAKALKRTPSQAGLNDAGAERAPGTTAPLPANHTNSQISAGPIPKKGSSSQLGGRGV